MFPKKLAFSVIYGVLYTLVAPFIPALFSWFNALPVAGQIIFCIIVAVSLWFAGLAIYAYYIEKSGLDISLKWKWFTPYIQVAFK